MTRRSSTSSQPRDESETYEQVVALGNKIVEEMSDSRYGNTLLRWMAFRIAELIETAKNESVASKKRIAQSECEELILKVWTHRSAWPDGWPPSNARAYIDALEGPGEDRQFWKPRYEAQIDLSAVTSHVEALKLNAGLQEAETELWIDIGLASVDLTAEEDWLKLLSPDYANDDADTIELLVNRAEIARDRLKRHNAIDESGVVSQNWIRSNFSNLASQRAKLLDRVLTNEATTDANSEIS